MHRSRFWSSERFRRALYVVFVFVQTVRHRAYFVDEADTDPGGTRPSDAGAAASAVLLLLSPTVGVLVAKALSDPLNLTVQSAGLPVSFVGVAIASVVLLPEGVAAMKAAVFEPAARQRQSGAGGLPWRASD